MRIMGMMMTMKTIMIIIVIILISRRASAGIAAVNRFNIVTSD
jgi:hypothetical protein